MGGITASLLEPLCFSSKVYGPCSCFSKAFRALTVCYVCMGSI